MSPKLTGRRGCQKKTIAIFSYKQRLMSIDMKTKIVQHVKREWMREWESVRVWECESARVWEWESVKVREWLLSIDMKTKVVQHVKSEWIREWKSESVKVREWESEWECSGSQLLSDIQTFFLGRPLSLETHILSKQEGIYFFKSHVLVPPEYLTTPKFSSLCWNTCDPWY